MAKVRSLLVISNGHGEDIIGAALVKHMLEEERGLWIRVMPIVGEGKAYQNLPIKFVGPLQKLPSGGLMRLSVKNFLKDVKGGMLSLTYRQIQTLRKIGKEVDMVIGVGDVLLVLLAGLFVRKPFVFIPTAKSEYINGHYAAEKKLMRKYSQLVLPRDLKTAEVLREAGVKAEFVGNPMMDSFQVSGKKFGIEPESKVVGILPGSRDDAYANMKLILPIVEHLHNLKVESMDYLVAIADQISLDVLERTVNAIGWQMMPPEGLAEEGVNAVLNSGRGARIKLVKGYFGDVLEQSQIFIGLAGTANEQAVGCGKPLVTFQGKGAQNYVKFLESQKKLLGDSIAVVERNPEKIATEILVILHDLERYAIMGEIGLERMGPRGGIGRMSEMILRELNL